MDELVEQFLLEGRDLVAQAHAALAALGRAAGDGTALDGLFRAAHTLKGSVALFDMAPAERLLHAAETRLDAARKRDMPLDEAALDALVAVIDQTDRWIDAMEANASLPQDAAQRSAALIELLAGKDDVPAAPPVRPQDAGWLATLRTRPEFAELDPETARTAFRYMPDAECFFRGEDPLAVAGKVPNLLALAVLPSDGEWPSLAAWEPFRCAAVIEGVSGADEAAVRAAFRLMPDQILVEPIGVAPMPGPASRTDESTATLRVEAARLDRLADQSGELAVAIRSLKPIADRLRRLDPALAAELGAAEEQITRVAQAVRRSVAQVRLVSLEPVLRRLPRLAREAAAGLGKAVRFALDGEHVQVDKQMADQLFEPLLHLVRNAVDHGIESPDDRLAGGKAGEGSIRLSVRREGAAIAISLSDDGRGIDPDAVRRAVAAKGLMSPEAAASMSDEAILGAVFLPGFSTVENATSLSGRGVGMDAVKAAVDRLCGTIAIESEAGKGTCVRLRLPANAVTTPLLVVGAGDQRLGIRLDQIVETARIEAAAIRPIGRARACVLRDRTVPVLDLAEILGLTPTQDDVARMIVTDVGQCRTAVRVARLGDRFDAVVRDGAGLAAAMPAFAGTTIMADGSVLIVVDLAELIA